MKSWSTHCKDETAECIVMNGEPTCKCTDEEKMYDEKENKCKNFCSEGEIGEVNCSKIYKKCESKKEAPFFTCGNCIEGYNLVDHDCVDYCLEGQIGEKNCSKMHKECKPIKEDPFYTCENCTEGFILVASNCVDYCTKGQIGERNCSEINKECHSLTIDPFFSCGNCTEGYSLFDNKCIDFCAEEEVGKMNCSKMNKECVSLIEAPYFKCGNCTEGYSLVNDECIDPCEPNPCKNGGTCIPEENGKYTCSCAESFYGNNCTYQDWCVTDRHSCAQADDCVIDKIHHTYICKCEEGKYYDYKEHSCEELDKCIGVSCDDDFKTCQNGNCTCIDGFEDKEGKCEITSEKCEEICKTQHTKCKIKQYPYNIECSCEEDYHLSATSSKCIASECTLPAKEFNPCDHNCELVDGNVTCSCFDDFEKKENKCELKSENKCNNTCENGIQICVKDKEEKCICNKGYAEINGICTDICKIEDNLLVKELCPHGCLRENDEIRCNCTGNYIQADDKITCKVKNFCEPGEKGNEECAKKNGICKVLPNEPWYTCECPKNYHEIDKICTDSCGDNMQKECALTQRMCQYKDISGEECVCPPSMMFDTHARLCQFAERNFFFTLKLKSGKSKKYMANAPVNVDSDIHLTILRAMRSLYGESLETVTVLNCSDKNEDLDCTISLAFNETIPVGSEKRILHAGSCVNLTKSIDTIDSSDYCIFPPGLVVARKSLSEENLFKSQCSEKVRHNFCPDVSNDCFPDEPGYRCLCKKGFEVVKSFIMGSESHYKYDTCQDINECINSPCWEHSSCENTIGSYSCVCDKGYVLTETKDKCRGLCDPTPCKNNGECKVVGGIYECQCPKGYKGGNCEIQDEYLQKANTNIIVVGAVLGSVLFISFIVIIVLIRKIKRRPKDDEYDGQMDDYGRGFGKGMGEREKAIRGDRYGKQGYDNPAAAM